MSPMFRVSIVLTVALAVLAIAPAAQARVPERFFGAMWDREAIRAPEAAQDQQWALMAASGVRTVRTVFWWSKAEFSAGQPYDFSETDAVVARAARNDIELLPLVMTTPEWARLVPGEYGSPPKHVSDYTAYLRALVLRYGPAGSFWDQHPELPRRPQRHWQIWNEPHLDFYWSTKGRRRNAWAPEYARLLKASERTIEAIDPGATIVLAGLADFAWNHLDRLNRSRIRRHFDVAALNLFTGRPKLLIKGINRFRARSAAWPRGPQADLGHGDHLAGRQEPGPRSGAAVAARLVYDRLGNGRPPAGRLPPGRPARAGPAHRARVLVHVGFGLPRR